MLLDPAISGAIAADRVAWMALAKFNTGGQLGRAPPHVSLSPSLSQLTTTHQIKKKLKKKIKKMSLYPHLSPNLPPPTAQRHNCTLHTTCTLQRQRQRQRQRNHRSLSQLTTANHPEAGIWAIVGPLSHFRPFWTLWSNLGPLGHPGLSGLFLAPWAQNGPEGSEWFRGPRITQEAQNGSEGPELGWLCGCTKLRQLYIFAHICANFRTYAEYADMRTDAHWKKVAHGQPYPKLPRRPEMRYQIS